MNGVDGNELGGKLGLPEGQFTVDGISDGLKDKTITINETALSNCRDALSVIPCTDVTQNITASDFSKVENIVPTACGGVFTLLVQ